MTAIVDLSVPTRDRRGARLFVLAIAMTLTVTGVVATQHVKVAINPMAKLDEARAFAQKHTSARFTAVMNDSYSESDGDVPAAGELGSRTTSRSRVEGEIEGPGRVHTLTNSGGDGAEEAIIIGSNVYERYADTVAELPKEKWAQYSMTGGITGGFDPTGGSGQFDIDSLLAKADNPATVSHDGDTTTISAALSPTKLFGEQAAKFITSFTTEFTTIEGGELQSSKVAMHGKSFDATIETKFRDWGTDIKIFEPAADQIDATPDVDEEELAAYHDAPLYLPKTIPTGWAVDYAELLSKEDSGEHCAQMEIDLDPINADFDDDDTPYVELYQMPTSCAEATGDAPFHAGPYVGTIDTEDGESFVQMKIDDKTTMQVWTNLPPAELAKLVGELVPFNPGLVAT